MTKDLLPEVMNHILRAFQDSSDDVRAVAASALLPVTGDLALIMPQCVSTRDLESTDTFTLIN